VGDENDWEWVGRVERAYGGENGEAASELGEEMKEAILFDHARCSFPTPSQRPAFQTTPLLCENRVFRVHSKNEEGLRGAIERRKTREEKKEERRRPRRIWEESC
jgi:hypothetical protein